MRVDFLIHDLSRRYTLNLNSIAYVKNMSKNVGFSLINLKKNNIAK